MLTTHTRNASASDANTLERIITNVLVSEADAIHAVIDETRESLAAAINLIFQSSGPLIVSGVGKSGHIARKMASTFRSLGKHASFLHARAIAFGVKPLKCLRELFAGKCHPSLRA